MTARLIRRIAIALLALYAFGQASVALAACGMDREAMARAMAMPAGEPCGGCAPAERDSVGAVCVAHCTADLQTVSTTPGDAAPPSAIVVPLKAVPPVFRSALLLACPPPGAPPRRILLHSFQI